jgi:hypothetical protein
MSCATSPTSATSATSAALAARFTPSLLDTILGHLALLFLAGAAGDMTAARDAAAIMLAAYHPETEDELRLAAEIVSFSFHALEALGQAATPDMPLTKILRLRGSAVSLSRESHKAERRLDQLQKARRAGAETQPNATQVQPDATPATPPPPEPARPRIDKAIALVEATRQAIATTSQSGGKTWTHRTWTQSYQKHEAARRITENLKRNQANHAAQLATAAPAN